LALPRSAHQPGTATTGLSPPGIPTAAREAAGVRSRCVQRYEFGRVARSLECELNLPRRSHQHMARKDQGHTAKSAEAQREAGDETVGDEGGGRGGRSRGTATRSGSSRTTIASRGEVEGRSGPSRDSHAARKGKGSKTDAPQATRRTSGTGSSGAKKSGNRPGASGTGSKKGTRGSSSDPVGRPHRKAKLRVRSGGASNRSTGTAFATGDPHGTHRHSFDPT
jgi:hypothetical protein